MNFYELSELVREDQQEGVLGQAWQGAKQMTGDAMNSLKRSYQHGQNQVNTLQNKVYGQDRAAPYPEPGQQQGQQQAPAMDMSKLGQQPAQQGGEPAQQMADLQQQVAALTQQLQQLMAAQQQPTAQQPATQGQFPGMT